MATNKMLMGSSVQSLGRDKVGYGSMQECATASAAERNQAGTNDDIVLNFESLKQYKASNNALKARVDELRKQASYKM